MGELARVKAQERRHKWVGAALAAAMLLAVSTALAVGARGESGVARPAAAAATDGVQDLGALDVVLAASSARPDAPNGAGAGAPEVDALLGDSPEPEAADSPQPEAVGVAVAAAEEPPSASSSSPAYPPNTSTVGVAPGPGSWSRPALPGSRVDWLHIPKCGTTFVSDLLRFQCDREISDKLGQRDDAEALALEDVRHQHLLWAAMKGGSPYYACQLGLRNYHRPLAAQGGHKSRPVSRVVSFFRDPISRVASGFVNGLHDCERVERQVGISSRSACIAFAGGNTSAGELKDAKRAALLYAKCVQGCQGRMVTGDRCDSSWRHSPRAEAVAARARKAVAKLRDFAFVGITERWGASACVFKRDFPRPSGRKYPEQEPHFRASNDHQCEDKVAAYLRKKGFVDVLDSAVYDAALAEFSRRVGNCSAVAG